MIGTSPRHNQAPGMVPPDLPGASFRAHGRHRRYDIQMSEPKDERDHRSRRAAIRDTLISSGKDPAVAERWCEAWEAEAALRDHKHEGDYWDAGKLWIDAQCAAGKRPPN
jgi:hypothetical protein